ncbi:hypothetical protein AVEN_250476-1 [Araneus ventricosus]|uniref:Uncharacterized protein n=1 Tax=Araneus ventricosus TaxID=182803 RepID=A0A4Y2IJI0_ARAVE|nr:hypothetical protein AVEN_250476-1 [Araneus ventricosus]
MKNSTGTAFAPACMQRHNSTGIALGPDCTQRKNSTIAAYVTACMQRQNSTVIAFAPVHTQRKKFRWYIIGASPYAEEKIPLVENLYRPLKKMLNLQNLDYFLRLPFVGIKTWHKPSPSEK